MIPDDSPVGRERGVHAKAEQVVAIRKNVVEFPDALHKHRLQGNRAGCRNTRDKFEHGLLEFLSQVHLSKADLAGKSPAD